METPLKLNITLKDNRAIELVKRIPPKKIDETIEKYIILGDMVCSHATISTSKESIANFFAPLEDTIETVSEQLKLIIPTIATPARKGAITVESIFKSFGEHFFDDSFEDVSGKDKFTDIVATDNKTKTETFIELKDYSGTVPTSEVEKFWRDMELRNNRYGIFISMRSGIAKISSSIKMETKMNRTAIFIINSELNWSGHLFAYYILKKVMALEALRKEDLSGKDLSGVVLKVNKYLTEMREDIKVLEEIQDITDGLKTTSVKKLDKIIELADRCKRKLDEKIDSAFQEISKVEK